MPVVTHVCRVARLHPDAGSVGVTAIDHANRKAVVAPSEGEPFEIEQISQ